MFIDRPERPRRGWLNLKVRSKGGVSARRRLRPGREALEERTAPATGAWSALAAVETGPALVSSVSTPSAPGLAAQNQYAISEAIGRGDPLYAIQAAGDGHVLSSPTNRYDAAVDAGGLRVTSGADVWSLTVTGVGYGDDLKTLGEAVSTVDGNRVDYDYGGLSQWFVNGPLGLQQGFTLTQRPTVGDGLLTVDLVMGGSLIATADAGGRGVTLARADGSAALSYGGLIAYDATGRETPAFLSVRSTADGDLLSIQVDDSDAVYPLVIDPLVQQTSLSSSAPVNFGYFGYSVSISGDGNRAVVGAKDENGASQPTAGAVYVFDRSGTSWTRTARLTAGGGLQGDQFGYSVAISQDGTTVAVGAASAQIGGVAGRGAVYVFTNTAGSWGQAGRLLADDGVAGDFLGTTVSVSGNGDTIVAGAASATIAGRVKQGAAYVFSRTGGAPWSQTAKLTASDGAVASAFGLAVTISAGGGSLAVAAPGASIGNNVNQGAVYVFDKSGSSWVQKKKLVDPSGAGGDMLGVSLSMSSDGAVVLAGAPQTAVGSQANQGAAHVFTRAGSTWTSTRLTAADGAAFDAFGESVSLSADGTLAVIGASRATIDGRLNQGAAYVFKNSGSTWSPSTKLMASEGRVNDTFGQSVAANLNGSTVIVGAPTNSSGPTHFQGSAFVFFDSSALSISVSPSSRTANPGVPTTFTAAVAGPSNTTVRWQLSINGGPWNDIPGATNPWYTMTPSLADSGNRYRAVFTGDEGSATTSAAVLTVVKPAVFLNLSSNVNPRRMGDPLNIIIDAMPTTSGAGVPDGGKISVNIGSVNYSGTLRNGKAVFAIPMLTPGSYTVTATYDGATDPAFGSATATMKQVIDRGTSTITASPDFPTHATIGQSVTLKAALSFAGTGIPPTGGVVFLSSGQPIGFAQIVSEGGQMVASHTIAAIQPGRHYFQMVYLGETMALPSSSDTYSVEVGWGGAAASAPRGVDAGGGTASGSSLVGASRSAPSAPSTNDLIRLAAAIPPVAQTATAGIPTTFTAAPTNSATRDAQWQVSANGGSWRDIPGATNWWYTMTPSLADSGNRYRAVFTGGGESETTSPAELTVVKSGTFLKLSSNVNPRRIGDPLNIIIDAMAASPGAGVPDGGKISVNIGSVNYSGTLHNGKAVFAIPMLTPGSYTVTATYDGANDPAFGSSTATMIQVIDRGTSTITASPDFPTHAQIFQPVTLKAALSFEGTGIPPTGGVMFLSSGQPIGFAPIESENGQMVAKFKTSALQPGNNYFQMVYLGETMALPSSSDTYVITVGGSSGRGVSPAPVQAAATPPSVGSLPKTDGIGLAAALSIAEATKPKSDNPFAPQNGETATSSALALPSALTARRLQQRYTAAYKPV